jgi:hypothetical protein
LSQHRRAAGVLLVLAWGLWFHRWVPALLVVAFVVWVILHNRLEAGLGEALQRRWRRAWPPGSLALIALLFASALAFVLDAAPAKMKIMPVGLAVLALAVILGGKWWMLVALPRWLGGSGSRLNLRERRVSRATDVVTLPATEARPGG